MSLDLSSVDKSGQPQQLAPARAFCPPDLSESTNCAISQIPLNRNILALDLGTKTGWAIQTRDGRRMCGTESFTPRASWSPGQRGLRFRAWLSEMITKHDVHGIWYEIVYRHVGTQAAHLYGAFEMLLHMAADSHRLTVGSVGVATIKKHAAGSGRAKKGDMITAMKAKGWMVDSDNAADAAAILEYAVEKERA